MQTKDLKHPRRKIARCIAETTIDWMPIERIPGLLERKYGYNFDPKDVMEYVRNSRECMVAWAPGSRSLVASNNHILSDFRVA